MAWFKRRRRNLSRSDLRNARSSKYLIKEMYDYTDVQELYYGAAEYLKRHKIRLVKKNLSVTSWQSSTSTLSARRIATSKDFSTYGKFRKAVILWHELVHTRQQRDWRFLPRWLSRPGYRWATEMQAYVQLVGAYAAVGKDSRPVIESIARTMRKEYALKRYDAHNVYGQTKKVLMEARAKALKSKGTK